jgi:L-malate glycosyltransferase
MTRVSGMQAAESDAPVAAAPLARESRATGSTLGRLQIRAGMACYITLLRLARRIGRRQRPVPPAGADVLMTGTFHSDNWVRSHIGPLAASSRCVRLRIVATNPVPSVPKVEAIYPPAWAIRLFGAVPARLCMFAWVAMRTRPDVVGAFHLLVNGLVATLVGRIIGARSTYFCVGGPVEVLDGGIWGENRYFARLGGPDPLVERWLLEAVQTSDLVVTMGTRAARFFRERGITTRCEVVAGGIDTDTFRPGDAPARYDAILVARLVPIKSIDIFLRAVAEISVTRPGVSAAVVGDGPLRAELEELARRLGLEGRVTFAGQHRDVETWLRQSRVFVLTSRSEGLALSLIEAMLCGLPAVVPRVGDLDQLVADGTNGYLIDDRQPASFAAALRRLLDDETRLQRFGSAARSDALRFGSAHATQLWDRILGFSSTPSEAARDEVPA